MIETDCAIKVEGLSKYYRLYPKPSDRLREALHPLRKKYHREFAALKNMTFDIPKGQVVGIVGRNGSGKSTLLKILTGVLTPSTGSVEVSGKVAALLELGAGFNPELTGRENVYLNGSIMGYSRAEMDSRLGDILNFADIGEFIEQPVRMYSSGMFVRLAFAVAINVDPDILIIDEALSVGDLRFQQKCIRKIQEFFERKKTVIFVGHDLGAINSFCSHCLWINEGHLVSQGSPAVITKEYASFMAYGMQTEKALRDISAARSSEWIDTTEFDSFGDREALITSIRVSDQNGRQPSTILDTTRVDLDMAIVTKSMLDQPLIGILVKDRLGNNAFGGNTFVHNLSFGPLEIGAHRFRLSFLFPTLSNGDYALSIALADGHQHDHVQKHWIHDCFVFRVANHHLRYQNGDGLVMEGNFDFKKISSANQTLEQEET